MAIQPPGALRRDVRPGHRPLLRGHRVTGVIESPQPLKGAFVELLAGFGPLAGPDGDPETLAEVGWSALHGLVTLDRDGRLRSGDGHQDRRIALLVARFTGPAPK